MPFLCSMEDQASVQIVLNTLRAKLSDNRIPHGPRLSALPHALSIVENFRWAAKTRTLVRIQATKFTQLEDSPFVVEFN